MPNRLHSDILVLMVQTPVNYFFGRVPNSPHASNNLAPTSEFNSQQSINSVVTETATSYGILLILAAATVGSSPFPFSIISISLSLDSANPSPLPHFPALLIEHLVDYYFVILLTPIERHQS